MLMQFTAKNYGTLSILSVLFGVSQLLPFGRQTGPTVPLSPAGQFRPRPNYHEHSRPQNHPWRHGVQQDGVCRQYVFLPVRCCFSICHVDSPTWRATFLAFRGRDAGGRLRMGRCSDCALVPKTWQTSLGRAGWRRCCCGTQRSVRSWLERVARKARAAGTSRPCCDRWA